MMCDQALQVQAYADGELDAMAAAAIERHLESCAECARLLADIEGLRRNIRQSAVYHRADDGLRRHVLGAIDGDPEPDNKSRNRRPFWLGAFGGAAATALAASFVFALFLPSAQDRFADDMVSAHLRSLVGTHLIDVASSNHHVVKPWFAGRVDIAPPVGDFAKDGFPLVGGRVDYVHGARAAVLVYRHGAHVANVFVWKDDGSTRAGWTSANGYHALTWKSGDLAFCEVSDMAKAEAERLSALIRENRAS
jgi:anti-sigma factor RsiW